MLHCRAGARFPPDVTLGIQAKEFNLGFIRPENLVSHGLRIFRCLLENSKRAVMWWSAAEMVVLLEGSPISTEELWSSVNVTIGFLGHLPDEDPSPPIAQFGRAASSKKSIGGYKLCLLYTSPSPRDLSTSRMPSSA